MIECFRKLVLVGLALFIAEQGSLAQTAAALIIVLFYVMVLLRAQPYKLPSDNHVALLVNAGFGFVMFASLLLKCVGLHCLCAAMQSCDATDTERVLARIVSCICRRFVLACNCFLHVIVSCTGVHAQSGHGVSTHGTFCHRLHSRCAWIRLDFHLDCRAPHMVGVFSARHARVQRLRKLPPPARRHTSGAAQVKPAK